jgi:hypothetical protein
MHVTFASATTFAEHEGLMQGGEVGDMFVALNDFTRFWVFLFDDSRDDGAAGDFINDIWGTTAAALIATAFFAVIGEQFGIVKKRSQAVRAVIYEQDDAAAVTAVPSIRTAFGTELASVEMDGAVAAFTGAGINFDLIDKHGSVL